MNGATCTDLHNGYTCNCAVGYEGRNCEKGRHIQVLDKVYVRAATDPADPDPDPDLLTTRIQNLRSGSVKELCTTNFCTKF